MTDFPKGIEISGSSSEGGIKFNNRGDGAHSAYMVDIEDGHDDDTHGQLLRIIHEGGGESKQLLDGLHDIVLDEIDQMQTGSGVPRAMLIAMIADGGAELAKNLLKRLYEREHGNQSPPDSEVEQILRRIQGGEEGEYTEDPGFNS